MTKKVFAALLALMLTISISTVGTVLAKSPTLGPPDTPGPPPHAVSVLRNHATGERIELPIQVDVHTLGSYQRQARYMIKIPRAILDAEWDPVESHDNKLDPNYSVYFSVHLTYWEVAYGTPDWRVAYDYSQAKWVSTDYAVTIHDAFMRATCYGSWYSRPGTCNTSEDAWVGSPSTAWYFQYPTFRGTSNYLYIDTTWNFIAAVAQATMRRGVSEWTWSLCVAEGGQYEHTAQCL